MIITFSCSLVKSFLAGVNAPQPPQVSLEVDPAELAPEVRAALAARMNEAGQICARDREGFFSNGRHRVPSPSVGYAPRSSYDGQAGEAALVRADLPTIESLLEAIAAEEAVVEAEAAKQAAVKAERDAAYAAQQEAYRAQKEAEEQAAAHKAQAKADWIASHGSRRLQRLVAEEIEHGEVYARERQAWEAAQLVSLLESKRPGWSVASSQIFPVENVGARSFALLDAARAVAPGAKLGRHEGRVVAWEKFEGRIIIWPRD